MRETQHQALKDKVLELPRICERHIWEIRGVGFDAEVVLVHEDFFGAQFHDALHESDLRVKHSGILWQGDYGYPRLVLKFDV